MENKLFLNSFLRRMLAVAGLAWLSASGMHAAERVNWDALDGRIGAVRSWRADVYTHAGKKYAGFQLSAGTENLKFYDRSGNAATVPRGDVKRIKFWRPLRFASTLGRGATFPFKAACDVVDERSSKGCSPVVFVATTPVWAFTAVSAPFFLLGDGIGLIGGSRVFDVVQ